MIENYGYVVLHSNITDGIAKTCSILQSKHTAHTKRINIVFCGYHAKSIILISFRLLICMCLIVKVYNSTHNTWTAHVYCEVFDS